MTVRGQRTGSRYYACLENGEQTFGQVDAGIYRNIKGDLRALAIAEELSQVGAGGGEIQRRRSGQPPRSLPSESPTFETLLRRLDKLARQFAETPTADPLKSEIANEITRLSFLADALFVF